METSNAKNNGFGLTVIHVVQNVLTIYKRNCLCSWNAMFWHRVPFLDWRFQLSSNCNWNLTSDITSFQMGIKHELEVLPCFKQVQVL